MGQRPAASDPLFSEYLRVLSFETGVTGIGAGDVGL